jgi:hypothetical protein
VRQRSGTTGLRVSKLGAGITLGGLSSGKLAAVSTVVSSARSFPGAGQLAEREDARHRGERDADVRGNRLKPLAQKDETVEAKKEEGMSDEEFAMLQALDQGDDNAVA